jgi:polyisoprenoid-binding protein YceI
MKKAIGSLVTTLALLACLACLAASAQAAPKWEIDPPHGYVGFAVRHILAPIQGVFNRFSGDILFDPDDLATSRVDVSIEVASLDTRNQKRDEHLRSEDFFAANAFPLMRFQSRRIMALGQGRFVARGNLTIKGVSKEIDLPFTFLGKVTSPMNPNVEVVGFSARHTIDRLEYGVGDGHFYRLGMAGKDVEIVIDLELTRLR